MNKEGTLTLTSTEETVVSQNENSITIKNKDIKLTCGETIEDIKKEEDTIPSEDIPGINHLYPGKPRFSRMIKTKPCRRLLTKANITNTGQIEYLVSKNGKCIGVLGKLNHDIKVKI